MKRTIIVSVLLTVLAVGLVTAQPWGTNRSGRGAGSFAGGPCWTEAEAAPELETLEGRLRLEEDRRPVLTVDGEEYELLLHAAIASELSVENGQTITVEGYVVTVRGRDLLGDERLVHVRAVEAGGTRVVMPERIAPMGRYGHGFQGGPMGRRGGPTHDGPYGNRAR